MSAPQERLDAMRALINMAEVNLRQTVAEECPGEHKATQHRDGQPAWCPTCGRSDRGVLVKEVDLR